MANTYTQLYFHIVFAVKGRSNHIAIKWGDELSKYIAGIIANKNQKLMLINGVPNHVHLLIGTKPTCSLSDLVRDIKANSSKWINEKQFVNGKFEWQSGFGAFTIGQSQVPKTVNDIKNQEEHHKSKSFKKEYINFLNAYAIEFDSAYTFKDD